MNDGGTAQIAASFGLSAAARSPAAAEVSGPADSSGGSAIVQLCAALQSNTAALMAAEARKRDMAAAVSDFPFPAFSFTSLPAAAPVSWGPKDGWSWAIQSVVVAGLGATTDFATVYKGQSTADAVKANSRFTFSVSIVGAVSTWHPGRTGLILHAGDRLVLGGTFTGTEGVVTGELVQIRDDQLCYFLL